MFARAPFNGWTVGAVLGFTALAASLAVAAGRGTPSLNKPVLVRTGTFSVSLAEQGRTMGMFRCRLRATQYTRGFTVRAWPRGGWLRLPRGHWNLASAIRGRDLPPEGSFGVQTVRVARTRKVAITLNGSGALQIDSGKIGARLACGVLAFPRRGAYKPNRHLFATVAWPSFKLLGANVPVDATQPDGGVG